jgi:uncharacterized protein YbjT (DUF2867 family)
MPTTRAVPLPRRALIAGASGLVGRSILKRLLESPHYTHIDVLLRRPAVRLPDDARITEHIVDFDKLPPLPAVDDVYIALGTTLKTAGSQAAFKRVDFDAVVNTACAARGQGATRLAVVSALGANAKSPVFYSRIKGEMESALTALGYTRVVIAQPSLLTGNRLPLFQPERPLEKWADRLLTPMSRWLPNAVRPIAADTVAAAMVQAMTSSATGLQVMRSSEMQTRQV